MHPGRKKKEKKNKKKKKKKHCVLLSLSYNTNAWGNQQLNSGLYDTRRWWSYSFCPKWPRESTQTNNTNITIREVLTDWDPNTLNDLVLAL